jgi:hypothetical protein
MKRKSIFILSILFSLFIFAACSNEVETLIKEVYVQVDYNRPSYKDVQVGDVILEDGTIIPYLKGYGFTQEQRENAIAVVVYSNQEFALCVGLKSNQLTWFEEYTYYYEEDFKTEVFDINGNNFEKENGSVAGKLSDIETYTGYDWGSSSYSIMSKDPIHFESKAFEWIHDYGNTYSITGMYASGWYMPALKELMYLNENYDIVRTIFSALGATIFTEAYSSSCHELQPYRVNFSSKEFTNYIEDLHKTKKTCIAFHSVILK